MAPQRTLLAVNCGSSSIKYRLFSLPDLTPLSEGGASNIGTEGAVIKTTLVSSSGCKKTEDAIEGHPAYEDIFEQILQKILISNGFERDAVEVVAHRVVHGAEESKPIIVRKGQEEGLEKMDIISAFAPLHNHHAVLTVRSVLRNLPKSTSVLCFDTLFHASLPKHITTYPLPPQNPDHKPRIPLRKYGAHGLSYASVLRSVSQALGKKEEDTSIVITHLGSGGSLCAVRKGKSIDTSMGLTPLEGIPGGTRTGSVDPTLIFHWQPHSADIVDFKGMKIARGEMIMNKQGGLVGMCGTNNFGKIVSHLPPASDPFPDPPVNKYQLAYAVYLDRLLHFFSSYLCKLLAQGPVDGIVFTGGIGEKAARLRSDVGKALAPLGVEVDEGLNEGVEEGKTKAVRIGKEGAKVQTWVAWTDEEETCARMAVKTLEEER